ncbi:MAG: hypothetical protein CVT68_04785 [Actinobacteria bacterium HGW-Actinobacteria-8]|nr:MAG: hypothetical protein CVT68_04785 [Actinobacteria bacterium HGW-Actinobacteria-8]
MIRRRPVQRLTSLLIGAIITALGAITIAVLSGESIDVELVWIIGLAAVGGWLLLTAIMAGMRGDDAARAPLLGAQGAPHDFGEAKARADAAAKDPTDV